MAAPRFQRVLLTTLAALVLCAGLAPARVGATEEPAETSEAATITTVLHPGWNMVGWVGPLTLVADLYESIPELAHAWAWDATRQEYQRLPPRGVRSLAPLLPGDGLWLNIDADAPVEWTRSVTGDTVLFELRTGRNLVGWTGPSGVPVAEATTRFGDALVRALLWDAARQRYQYYQPPATANALADLNPGDALLIEVAREVRWWQAGTARTEFVFKGDIPPDLPESFQDEMERIITFFAERYGIDPPRFSILLDSESPWGRASSSDMMWLGVHAASSPSTVANTYFSVVQQGSQHRIGSPYWLTVGASKYAEGLYLADRDGLTYDTLRLGRIPDLPYASAPHLGDVRWTTGPPPIHVVEVGALAVEWLVGHAAASDLGADFTPLEPMSLDIQRHSDAFVEYFRPQRSARWEAAFETAFEIAPDDFYTAFQDYLAGLSDRRWPHLHDDRSEPAVMYLADVPKESRAEIDRVLREAQTFYQERFGVEGADFTLIVGAKHGEPLRTAYRWVRGTEFESAFCHTSRGQVHLSALECLHPGQTAAVYQRMLLRPLIPGSLRSTPRTVGGRDPRGPRWFTAGVAEYMTNLSPVLPPHTNRPTYVNRARWATGPLSGMETYAGAEAAGDSTAFEALSFLAVSWLAEYMGEPELLEYYRLLPIAESWNDAALWEEAFEGAFGIAVDDFYEAFEAYRARVAPPDEDAGTS